jgi:ribosomal protein S18 acetylase RimI-like enzyme
LRFEVLRKPLQGEFAGEGAEYFSFEKDAVHVIALATNQAEQGQVIGCVLFHRQPEDPRTGRLFQMAVLPAYQKQGIGRQLVRRLEEILTARGVSEVTLHSRHHAISFYERLGYEVFGPPFEEVGIAHRHMRRAIGDRQ